MEVSGAFHTPLMSPAVEPFKNALQRVGPARTPSIPVISNVDAEPYGQASTVQRKLVKQVSYISIKMSGISKFFNLFPFSVRTDPEIDMDLWELFGSSIVTTFTLHFSY